MGSLAFGVLSVRRDGLVDGTYEYSGYADPNSRLWLQVWFRPWLSGQPGAQWAPRQPHGVESST